MNDPLRAALGTPQTRPIPGREAEMQRNNAGGFGFIADDWMLLERFLITGSEGGTYYVREQDLTRQNMELVHRCVATDGARAVQLAHDINVAGRAPKVQPQLYLVAYAVAKGSRETKLVASTAARKMLRTGFHLLTFVGYLDALGGWNRSKRRLVANWFNEMEPERLAYQVAKYQNRAGWTMRDALRVSHPKAHSVPYSAIYDHICQHYSDELVDDVPELLRVRHLMLKAVQDRALSASEAAHNMIDAGLPREALPTESLTDNDVLRALLPSMPQQALVRNLGNLSRGAVELNSPQMEYVVNKLCDRNWMRRGRVHPFQLLLATYTYSQAHGVRSSNSWMVHQPIQYALEKAYYNAFTYAESTGLRLLLGLDVSGSMSNANCVGSPLSCSVAGAAFVHTLARTEPHSTVVQFDTYVRAVVPVSKSTSINALSALSGGGTDLAAPIVWAMGKDHPQQDTYGRFLGSNDVTGRAPEYFDAFVIVTDNETWAGHGHPTEMLKAYRERMNPHARLICCSMAANHANIVDPRDPLQFGCAGLDANLPSIVASILGQRQLMGPDSAELEDVAE